MKETITLGSIDILVSRKNVKNVHLSVHPPDGKVRLVAPEDTRIEVARAYAISKLGWIRNQQEKLTAQARETPRAYTTRESHYLWGRRYLLKVIEQQTPPYVSLSHRNITLYIRPGSDIHKRAEVLHEWYKKLLHEAIPPLLNKWQQRMGVEVSSYYIQRMKTNWGSCSHKAGNIRLNTELVKKPKHLLEYILVHEMAHLIIPDHSDKFIKLLDFHYPNWREAREELNSLPLAAENWTVIK